MLFRPERFSRFDVYWKQTDRQTNKQTDKPNLYIEGHLNFKVETESKICRQSL